LTETVLGRVYETVLYAEDVAAAISFYADELELSLVEEPDEAGAAFRLADGGMLLVFDPHASSRPGRPVPSHGAAGAGHVAFTVEAGSLDEWESRLAARGIDLEQSVDWDGRGRSLYVRDPAGNSVELVDGDIWPA
jgi:catechol 2,3-dioxygenase-like lactoylglutathione lyase family enzyme